MTDELRILKIDTCPTLSNKSTLTYHLGCDEKDELFIRVHANTGGGFFSQEWIAFQDIQSVLKKHPVEQPFTSILLYPLFRGKSVNTPAFLLAVLKQEGLARPVKDRQRLHHVQDSKAFLDRANKLIASKPNLNAVKKKTVRKKKTASSHTGR